MGLDTSHDCWHGAYSAFYYWRIKIAEVAGYSTMKGANGLPVIAIDWGHITSAELMGEWDRTMDDPLLYLIAHSDCEGVIHPAQGTVLAERLEQLLPLLPDGDVPGHIGNWKIKTQKFIDGLLKAHAANEDVIFS